LSSPEEQGHRRREELIAALITASRENSAAAVFFHGAIAERAGLGATDEKALDLLDRLGPLTAGEIAAHTGLTTAAVTSLIDRLEQRGYARRRRDSADRRRVIVEPDEAGQAEAARFYGGVQGTFAPLIATYSDEQLVTIIDFLNRASALARQIVADLPPLEGDRIKTGKNAG
jgi:DNA-binding MarR family transcriptional regulator